MKKFAYFVFAAFAVLAIFFFFAPAFDGREFVMPILTIGPLTLRWYGVIMALSVLLGLVIARNYSWRFGIDKKEVDDFGFWLIIASFFGARIYFVLFDFAFFLREPSEIYKFWHGGLSIYGAIIAGLAFTLLYARKRAFSPWQLLDLVAISLPLSQALGRVGNFFNSEAFGLPTSLPWKMFVAEEYRPGGYEQYQFFHPTFAYELVWSVVIFFLLKNIIGKVRSGIPAASYLGLYAFGRFFIESLRLDSVYVGSWKADQIVSLVILLAAGAIFLVRTRTKADSGTIAKQA